MVELTRAHERLRDELADDGIVVPGTPAEVDMLLTELEHARRPPIFENRSFMYGSFLLPADASLIAVDNLAEVIDLDMPIDRARRFADGRSSYVVRSPDDTRLRLACFRRSVQYEADLVELEQSLGGTIVQRTVMGTSRVFTPTGVVEWNGRRWQLRPSARVHLPPLRSAVPEASEALLEGLLSLAVHWLSPAHIGASFLLDLDPRPHDDHGIDAAHAVDAPALSVLERHHYPALFAMLGQSDLATLVHADGRIDRFNVGLRSSTESERAIHLDAGMRHRSAARYTWDHDHTVAFVVSEDGPVTLFRRGEPIVVCVDGSC